MIGITFKDAPGIGDKIQFTSVPENYYLATGKKLIDVDKSWVFDYNPFVVRDSEPDQIVDLWNYDLKKIRIHRPVYTCLAERNAAMLGVPAQLTHPCLYRFEENQANSGYIVIHTTGSPGIHEWRGYDQPMALSREVCEHVVNRYRSQYGILQVGKHADVPCEGAEDMRGVSNGDIWRLVRMIAGAQMFVGPDSGPSYIAACYPRVQAKKVLMQAPPEYFDDYIPMQVANSGTHWHDFNFRYYNRSARDAGMTLSYLKI